MYEYEYEYAMMYVVQLEEYLVYLSVIDVTVICRHVSCVPVR